MKKLLLVIVSLSASFTHSYAQSNISEKRMASSFPIAVGNNVAVLCVDAKDFEVVKKATALLQQDIQRVTGKKASIINRTPPSKYAVIIGTVGKSALIDQLVQAGKLKIDKLSGRWEAYQLQVIDKPFGTVDKALIIAGSDWRGTAYGVFELSKQMGVSPWYWWADVPVRKKNAIYYTGGNVADAPAVKYRGIFINDEAPALSGWTKEKFGGFNHIFYEKVFELMLRLKANYLWPAMWGNAFYDDDSLNIRTAEEYGIVIGTSHHEPLMRAHDEWRRYGKGKWDYDSNEVQLKEFWKSGMQRAANEKIVSIGMRGDGDRPMSRETATALLERIVSDQRTIIEEVTKKPAAETPQLWALYKEVQDYYDKGMRVPDDVTLLLCDDNWGNIRRLPALTDKPRKGGYGIYYHFDYVGGPRNYKWLNTNPLPRIWEQMHLAYEYNVKNIWIVNVGDIKPMELPISFFLDYAWAPDRISADDLKKYTQQWSAAQFGDTYASDIAEIISTYLKYNSRRKPELLDANTYSIHNYNEAKRVNNEYDNLAIRAQQISDKLPAQYKDAYFQLVMHPVKACANLYALYTTVAYNRWFASQKWLYANTLAEKAKWLYTNDSLITQEYHSIANGKWNHMMDQTHIGYTYWQQPLQQKMPEVRYVPADSAEEQGVKVDVATTISEDLIPKTESGYLFYEQDGYVSIGADHFTKAVNSNGITWKILPDHGRTGSAVTPFPVTAAIQKPGGNAPHLQYEMYLSDTGSLTVSAYFSPTLNIHNDEGLRYGVSIDEEDVQIISINKDDNKVRIWEDWVANNIIIKTSAHRINRKGRHVLKVWMVNPGVVLQKIVVDAGGLRPSYLGPPETGVRK